MYALSSEWLVLDAMWLFCGRTEFLAAPGFILREVAFKPTHLTVAFERKNVCCNAVKEPAVVANHYCTTRKLLKSIFQGTQGVDVEVVCWFVQQQNVSTALENFCEVNTVAFSTGKIAHQLLLVT